MVGQTSPITYATIKLTYPIFDAEFDPYSRGYLIVAGGGGENRTGVPNKLTLLDVSSRLALSEVAEINLSTDEDSPQSISSLTTKQGLITFAGISSSITDQKAGKNEHFRSFDVEFPPRKRQRTDSSSESNNAEEKPGRIALAGKSSLFKAPTPTKSKSYQRLLRLSPVQSRDVAGKRIGAIAAADATEDEIVLFDATTFIPNASSVLARLKTKGEAEDLDLFEHSDGQFSLAYCTPTDIYIHNISCDFNTKTHAVTPDDPAPSFSTPTYGTRRPKFRSIRWLGPNHVLVLQNGSPGGGPELIVVCIKKEPKSGPATLRHRLPNNVGQGVRLDVCRLDPDPATGERQIVIAAAAQNMTIHVLTCTHEPNLVDEAKQVHSLTNFSVVDTIRQHPQSISKICFGNFFPPRQSESANVSVATDPQYLQLASVSVGYTVAVESLALTTVPVSPSLTSDDDNNERKRPSVRWVLSTKRSELFNSIWVQALIALLVVMAGFLLQRFLVSRNSQPMADVAPGADSPAESLSRVAHDIGAESVLTEASKIISTAGDSLTVAASSVAASAQPPEHGTLHRIHDLFHRHRHHVDPTHPEQDASGPKKAILVRPASENPFAKQVHAELTDDVSELRAQGAKRFDELSKREQKNWKDKLTAAGKWSHDEGDTVLKGILFSEYANIVGGAIRDAIL